MVPGTCLRQARERLGSRTVTWSVRVTPGMREKQPRLLVIWGRYESSFDLSEPESYRRDIPNAEVHVPL